MMDDMGDDRTWRCENAWAVNEKRLRELLTSKVNVVVSDIGFCEKWRYDDFQRKFPEVQWVFFENDQEQCRKNVTARFSREQRTHRLDQELDSIASYGKTYDPPETAIPVYQEP